MTCPATLADAGRIPCQRTDPHQPHHGCLYELIDADVTRDLLREGAGAPSARRRPHGQPSFAEEVEAALRAEVATLDAVLSRLPAYEPTT
jgi:hypothetical protein